MKIFKKKDRVYHEVYGNGTVSSIDVDSRRPYRVAFDTAGVKECGIGTLYELRPEIERELAKDFMKPIRGGN